MFFPRLAQTHNRNNQPKTYFVCWFMLVKCEDLEPLWRCFSCAFVRAERVGLLPGESGQRSTDNRWTAVRGKDSRQSEPWYFTYWCTKWKVSPHTAATLWFLMFLFLFITSTPAGTVEDQEQLRQWATVVFAGVFSVFTKKPRMEISFLLN